VADYASGVIDFFCQGGNNQEKDYAKRNDNVLANLLVFLDSKLRIAKWIYGTGYSGHDVDLALNVASGESDWVGQHSEWLYALLLFAGSLLCVALVYYLLQLNVLRRAAREATGD